jgi:hypothetical protein
MALLLAAPRESNSAATSFIFEPVAHATMAKVPKGMCVCVHVCVCASGKETSTVAAALGRDAAIEPKRILFQKRLTCFFLSAGFPCVLGAQFVDSTDKASCRSHKFAHGAESRRSK